MSAPHDPRLQTKPGLPYATDDGQEIPEHTLYRYGCSCGWAGACWYAHQDRARAVFERHREAAPARPASAWRPWIRR